MADYNLNFTRTFLYKRNVLHSTECMTQLICMHMFNLRNRRVQNSITCQSRNNNMIISNC